MHFKAVDSLGEIEKYITETDLQDLRVKGKQTLSAKKIFDETGSRLRAFSLKVGQVIFLFNDVNGAKKEYRVYAVSICRIERSEIEIEVYYGFTYVQAIKISKNGGSVRRRNWTPGVYLALLDEKSLGKELALYIGLDKVLWSESKDPKKDKSGDRKARDWGIYFGQPAKVMK